MVVIEARSSQETRRIGELIGKAVQGGEVLALCGDLGAGKTTFVQGVAVGMGVKARITSPTFILLNQYTGAGGRRLVHVDAYRLDDAAILADAATFGLEEVLAGEVDADDVIAIEWADRVAPILPTDLLRIEFAAVPDDPDARTIRFIATGVRSLFLLEKLQI